ncbi:MAG: hypothetical protein JW918_07155 [Anaerolineae bacterium]|nr:hypothetical protein [Anaerolineae bacterium]
MIPKDEFWRVMEAYGAGISPAQIVFYIAAILCVGWVFLKPGKIQSLCAKLYLAVSFAWTGVAFYMILARDMAGDSYGNYVFGAVFVVVAALFAVDVFRQRMHFSLPAARWQKIATLVLMGLVFCYPLFGIASGHRFPSLIVPGTFPCPTVALGLLLLTTALPQVDRVIYILLLICAIPFTPFVQIARYGVYEDTILLATGIYSLVLLVRYWKAERLPHQPSTPT